MISFQFPHWILEGLLTSILVFGPFAFGAVEPWSLSILEILIFSMFFVCVWNQLKSRNDLIYQTLLPPLMMLTILALLQSLNPSLINGPKSFWPSTVAPHETRHAILQWSAYSALVWCIPKILTHRRHVIRLAWTLFLLGCAISVIGIIQRNSGDGYSIYGLREVNNGAFPFGPYYNPDHAASMMVMSVFVGLGILGLRFFTPDSDKRLEFAVTQVCILFMIGVIVFGILETRSRGALLSMICIGMCSCLMVNWKFNRSRYRHVASTLIIAFLSLAAVIIYMNPVRFRIRKVDLMSSINFRGALYQAGGEMFLDSPLTGTGMGAFRVAYPIYQLTSVKGNVHHIHSDWIELALQAGLLGLFAFASGVILLVRRSFQNIVAVRDGKIPCLAIGSAAAVGAFCLHSLIDFSFQIPANAILFLTLACMSVSVSRENLVSVTPPQSRWAYLMCILPVGLILLSARAAVGSIYRFRAEYSAQPIKPVFFSRAIYWDGRPEYFKLLGESVRGADREAASLSDALRSLNEAIRMEPANNQFRYLQAEMLMDLSRLRESDGRKGRVPKLAEKNNG